MRYNYVVIEGNIGAGKTTLAQKIAEEYSAKLVLEGFAENPFLPKFYENKDRHAFPLELSFLADRFQQLKTHFNQGPGAAVPATVSDYLFNKCIIFAGINLTGDEAQLYQRLFDIADILLPKPDLLVYLHRSTHNLEHFIKKRGRSYEQNIKKEYLENIHEGYMGHFKQLSDQRILVLDVTSIDFVKNENDYQKIVSLFEQDYSPGMHFISSR